MHDHTFTSKQVLQLVRMGPPALQDLVRRGIIVPSERRGIGRGTPSLFNVYDLVGIATVEFLRPKAASAAMMSALYSFWHSSAGRQVVDEAREARAAGVVVLDGEGNVSYEREVSVASLFTTRKTSMVHLFEPRSLVEGLFVEFAERAMLEPLPSGRLPRKERVLPPRDLQEKTVRSKKKKPDGAPRKLKKNRRGGAT
jgi:hypothetical protein